MKNNKVPSPTMYVAQLNCGAAQSQNRSRVIWRRATLPSYAIFINKLILLSFI